MRNRFWTVVEDSIRLLSVSVIQKIVSTGLGLLYLVVLSPAAYAAWKSVSTFFQISLPGWSLLQTEFARRRVRGDRTWVEAWKGILSISMLVGVTGIGLSLLFRPYILIAYPAAAPFAGLVFWGSFLFFVNPVRESLYLWWQVTGDISFYSRLKVAEHFTYAALIAIGFLVLRLGVITLPIALVLSRSCVMLASFYRWTGKAPGEGFVLSHPGAGLGILWSLVRGEGKWVMLRESAWDWFEALKLAVLNALFSPTVLGLLLAAEALAGYVTDFFSSIQPVLQVRIAEILDPERAWNAFQHGRRVLVLVSWVLYFISIPAVWVLTEYLFTKYEPSFTYYPLFALQLQWSAVAAIVMPYLYTLHQQRRLFFFTCERFVIELGTIFLVVWLFPVTPFAVVAGHLASGYWFTFRRVHYVERNMGKTSSVFGVFLPERKSFEEVGSIIKQVLRRVHAKVRPGAV